MFKYFKNKINDDFHIVENQQAIEKQIDDLVNSWSSSLKKELLTGQTNLDDDMWQKFQDFLKKTKVSSWSGKYAKPINPYSSSTVSKRIWSGKYAKPINPIPSSKNENLLRLENYKILRESFTILELNAGASMTSMFQVIDKHANELRKKLKDMIPQMKMSTLSYQLSPVEKEIVRPKTDKEIEKIKKSIEQVPTDDETKSRILNIIQKFHSPSGEKQDSDTSVSDSGPTITSTSSFRTKEPEKTTPEEPKPTKPEEPKPTKPEEPEKTKPEEPKTTTPEEPKPTKTEEPEKTKTDEPTISTKQEEFINLSPSVRAIVLILEDHNKLTDSMKNDLKNFENKKGDFFEKVNDMLIQEINNIENKKEKNHLLRQIEKPKRIKELEQLIKIILRLG